MKRRSMTANIRHWTLHWHRLFAAVGQRSTTCRLTYLRCNTSRCASLGNGLLKGRGEHWLKAWWSLLSTRVWWRQDSDTFNSPALWGDIEQWRWYFRHPNVCQKALYSLSLSLSALFHHFRLLIEVSICFCPTPEPLLVVQSTSLLPYLHLHRPSISLVVFLDFCSHWYSCSVMLLLAAVRFPFLIHARTNLVFALLLPTVSWHNTLLK